MIILRRRMCTCNTKHQDQSRSHSLIQHNFTFGNFLLYSVLAMCGIILLSLLSQMEQMQQQETGYGKNEHKWSCIYLICQGGYAQSYPAAAYATGRGADWADRLLAARALTSWAKSWSEWARLRTRGAQWHGPSQSSDFVHWGKQPMHGFTVKVAMNRRRKKWHKKKKKTTCEVKQNLAVSFRLNFDHS